MDGALYAVEAASGKTVWKQETGRAIKASPMLDNDGMIYVGSRDHHLWAIDAETGEVRWRVDLKSEIDAAVAIASGKRLIVASDDGVIRLFQAKK
jgi:outer membrane protein assembly factor BamB